MGGREAGDAIAQNRWKETVEKEIKVRLQWKEQYGHEYKQRQAVEDEEKGKKAAAWMTSDPKEEQENVKPTKVASPQKTQQLEPILDDADLPLFEMHPVTPAVTQKLYDGFSKEGKGRALYLATRKSKGPDSKFPYPVTEAQEVGWKQEEKGTFGKPKHGRSQTIRTFYRDNGVFYQNGDILPR